MIIFDAQYPGMKNKERTLWLWGIHGKKSNYCRKIRWQNKTVKVQERLGLSSLVESTKRNCTAFEYRLFH